MRMAEKYRPQRLADVVGQACIGKLKRFAAESVCDVLAVPRGSGHGQERNRACPGRGVGRRRCVLRAGSDLHGEHGQGGSGSGRQTIALALSRWGSGTCSSSKS